MKIGVLTSSISRKAGGLFWSVRSLALGVQQAECKVQIFSIADEFSDEDSKQWQNLDLRMLSRRGPASFNYAPGFARALDTAGLNLIHTHGLWMYPSLAAWRWSKRWGSRLVVSPRGMLDPWAICNSAWKKRLVGLLFEHAHLRSVACFHALCESEYQAIRDYGLSNPVAIIPNGVNLPELKHVRSQPGWSTNLPSESQVLLFLSRIHPKKGLSNLLHAWAQVWRQMPNPIRSWHLVIAGWDQGGHQAQLEHLAEKLGVLETIHFVGPQFDEQKAASLARADAFILPSFSEGLPMAVLEAWSYGLPVLMTPQCNLPEGLEAQAALTMNPEIESISAALENLSNLSEDDRLAMGERGRNLVGKHFTWSTIAAQMCGVYTWVVEGGTPPDCVMMD